MTYRDRELAELHKAYAFIGAEVSLTDTGEIDLTKVHPHAMFIAQSRALGGMLDELLARRKKRRVAAKPITRKKPSPRKKVVKR
jgi:hypothetical protein